MLTHGFCHASQLLQNQKTTKIIQKHTVPEVKCALRSFIYSKESNKPYLIVDLVYRWVGCYVACSLNVTDRLPPWSSSQFSARFRVSKLLVVMPLDPIIPTERSLPLMLPITGRLAHRNTSDKWLLKVTLQADCCDLFSLRIFQNRGASLSLSDMILQRIGM